MAEWFECGFDSAGKSTSRPGEILELSGTPYEQGYQHGEQAREAIIENLSILNAQVEAKARGDEKRLAFFHRVIADNKRYYEKTHPEYIEEFRGIAEGAGVSFDDIFQLNIPPYFLNVREHECTELFVDGTRTRTGGTLLAKTRDSAPPNYRQVVLRRRYDDGVGVVEVTVAGSFTWVGGGISTHGITMAASGVYAKTEVVDWAAAAEKGVAVDTHDLLRHARSLDEVGERIDAQPRMTSCNMVAADADRAVAWEMPATRSVAAPAADGWLVRSNHFTHDELSDFFTTREEYSSTHHRYDVGSTALSGREDWDADALSVLVASHDGYPQDSLCRAVREDGTGGVTVYAQVGGLPEQSFRVILGSPDESALVREGLA